MQWGPRRFENVNEFTLIYNLYNYDPNTKSDIGDIIIHPLYIFVKPFLWIVILSMNILTFKKLFV